PKEENLLAISRDGYGLRFALAPHTEISTRSGRRFAKVAEGDEIVGVRPAPDDGILCVATGDSPALGCDVSEVNVLANPGRGVTVIKTDDGVHVVGFTINEPLVLESDKGKTEEIRPLKKDRVPRGSKGRQVFSRKERVERVVTQPPTVPQLGSSASGADKSESKE